MLHAYQRGKEVWFLRQRLSQENRLPLEDIITSTIFGPLDLIEPQDAWYALAIAFGLPDANWRPSFCEFSFWPRSGIEPDLYVQFRDADGLKKALLVEVKWNSGFGTDQARLQWNAFAEGRKDTTLYHVLLARDALEMADHIRAASPSGRWKASLVQVTWQQMSERLRFSRRSPKDPVGKWCALTCAFLEIMGEKPFEGFGPDFNQPFVETCDGSLFWNGS